MVIGNGLLAKVFFEKYQNNDKYLIFASGVSNSAEKNEKEYIREINLIKKSILENPDKKLIYFSSAMILSGLDNKYFKHKLQIHKLIQDFCKNYLIIMLPQVFGNGGNKNNIVNYFVTQIKNEQPINVQIDTYRSIIDIIDVFDITNYCIDKINNKIICLSYIELITAEKLVEKINLIFNKKIKINLFSKGISLNCCNSSVIEDAIKFLKIDKNDYTLKVLIKYL